MMPPFFLRYWREILLLVLVVSVLAAAAYVRSVFIERDQLKRDNAVLATQLQGAAAMQQFANQVTEAISQIRIRSSVNVSRIESEPKPQFVDSRPLPFVPAGVLQAVYTSAAAAGGSPGAAPGGSLLAGESASGVLRR